MSKHPSHNTRSSDSSVYDEVCTICGATDIAGGGWGKLAEPCSVASPAVTTEEMKQADRLATLKAERVKINQEIALIEKGIERAAYDASMLTQLLALNESRKSAGKRPLSMGEFLAGAEMPE